MKRTMTAVAVVAATAIGAAQQPAGNWTVHNFDLQNSRFSPLAQITTENAGTLVRKWAYEQPGAVSNTPIVVDGLMYSNVGSKVVALNAATGAVVWSKELQPASPGGGRGPTYGDGKVYVYGPAILYALDAKTGAPVATFGDRGALRLINRALDLRLPEKYPPDLDPMTLGYRMSGPPLYHAGTLYLGLADSDNLIAGGLVVAVNATTGAVKWVFSTVPQGPQDEGWDVAKDTWSGSERPGGGVWTAPAIDPDLGLLYISTGNPSPDYDGSSRRGTNLFTNSLVALHAATGKIAWYFQTVHHDLWDRDFVTSPVLFDAEVNGRTVKGVAGSGKACYAYFLDRQTGKPLNPVVETPVPTKTDVPGEQVWPTQPIPYSARGVAQEPFCSTFPIVSDPALAPLARPLFHPFSANDFVIMAPGLFGGSNFGSSSFSRRTGLFYVTGKNDAFSFKLNPVGDTLKAGPGDKGHFAGIAKEGPTGVTPVTTVTAYAPVTGELVWQANIPGSTNGGNLVTAGDLVIQGGATGEVYAFDARTGRQVFRSPGGGLIRSSPITYTAEGKQFVALPIGNSLVAFGLP